MMAYDSKGRDLCPLTPRVLRRSEVTALAALYWPLAEVDNAVDVARLESGYNTGAWNNEGEDSRGIWQINVVDAAHPDLASSNLFDPQVCAYYAARIWADSGWAAWYHSAQALGLIPPS